MHNNCMHDSQSVSHGRIGSGKKLAVSRVRRLQATSRRAYWGSECVCERERETDKLNLLLLHSSNRSANNNNNNNGGSRNLLHGSFNHHLFATFSIIIITIVWLFNKSFLSLLAIEKSKTRLLLYLRSKSSSSSSLLLLLLVEAA